MAKNDPDSLSIVELAALRENTTDKLMEKVVVGRAELEAELERPLQYDELAKRIQAAPVAKAKKGDEEKNDEAAGKGDEVKEPIARAA